MTLSSPLVFNGLLFLGAVHAMPILEKGNAMYVLGADNLGACPTGYRPIRDEATCTLSMGDLGLQKNDPYPEQATNDPPGCFQYSFEGGGAMQNRIYFNSDLYATPAGGHSEGRHYVCVLEEFASFKGEWFWVGQNLASTTQTSTISWSQTSTSSTTDAFTWGLNEGATAGFMGVGVSVGSSQSWSNSVTQSIANMQGGSQSYACQSVSCESGNLFQWQIVGQSVAEYGGDDQTNRQCSFACLPSSMPAETVPKCPAGWCGDQACQCCNGDGWATNGEDVPLCNDANTAMEPVGAICQGCDA